VHPLAEGRGVVFTEASGDDAVRYVGDEDRVRQVLVNLLTNAVKFTEAGGTVSLEHGQTDEPHRDARLPGKGPWTFFRVSDNGIGIPSDQLSRIFQPFVQVETGHTRSRGGSGLGLTISRSLARLMGGDVTVRSTPGEGSIFTVWLPSPAGGASSPAELIATSGADGETRGLAGIGETLLREVEPVMEAFATRLRTECPVPGAETLKFSQLVDHVPSYVADLAGVLIALEEAGGEPSSMLADAADIHRLLAVRHGAQRGRLGWNEEAIRCEYEILREEIERVVQRVGGHVRPEAVHEALGVMRRFLDDAQQASTRALARGRGS
jgi:hypothetical protein